MLKELLKGISERFGLYLASTGRFGMDVDLDLARLTAASPLRTIFDVGANYGQTACRYARAFPSATIYSFEPVPTSFARLETAAKAFPQIRPFNCALGEISGHIPIHLAASSGSNSIKELRSSTGTIDVTVDTVDHICELHNISVLDLLKIDVEGYELPVLRGAAQRACSGAIRYVYAECIVNPNDEMPHTSFFDLHQFLIDGGFCFVAFYPQSFHLRMGSTVGNVLYAFREHLPMSVPGRIRNIV